MGGEVTNIQEMANIVSERLFKWFKWDRVELMDENFACVKVDSHTQDKTSHTHPVDVVFKYFDPYLNKHVYLNTDLKSYAKSSITQHSLRTALKSLALTIDCARASSEWQSRYIHDSEGYEIRGMLFVYNHDGDYHKNFFELVNPPKASTNKSMRLETLPLQMNQQLHLVEPLLINYMSTIVSDMNSLHHQGKFPHNTYEFYYPDLHYHKAHGHQSSNPATLEAIAAPYLIIYHNVVSKLNESNQEVEETFGAGYLIYYNRAGKNPREFIYLFDTLSKHQILKEKNIIRIRVAHESPDRDIISHFKTAVQMYSADWKFDEYRTQLLDNIEFEVVPVTKECFTSTQIGWRN